MRILVLESVSGLRREIDPRLFPEGFAMLRTMVKEFSEAGFDVVTNVNKKLKEYAEWLNARILLGNGGLSKALRLKPDAALVIAPEKSGELEKISAELRKKGIRILGAKEKPIRISGNKWLTYLKLKGKVPQPRTWKKKPNFEGRVLVKPIDGVGCEGIRFLESTFYEDKVIYQEFVKGKHASCCLLMRNGKGVVLSVNKQEIAIRNERFEYFGSEIPLKHRLARECAEVALKAAKAFNLQGFCGVDLVVSETPNFIELNPRVTTSFIALAKVLRANLGRILIDALFSDTSLPNPRLRGHSIVRIPRVKNDIKINEGKLDELRKIPGIVAPPFTFDGYLQRGSPIFVVAQSGNTAKNAERRLMGAINEATSLLGLG